MTFTIHWIRNLTSQKQRSQSDTPPPKAEGGQAGGQDTTTVFTAWRRGRLPFIGGINLRLAHQLSGKPAAGAGGKLVGSY